MVSKGLFILGLFASGPTQLTIVLLKFLLIEPSLFCLLLFVFVVTVICWRSWWVFLGNVPISGFMSDLLHDVIYLFFSPLCCHKLRISSEGSIRFSVCWDHFIHRLWTLYCITSRCSYCPIVPSPPSFLTLTILLLFLEVPFVSTYKLNFLLNAWILVLYEFIQCETWIT